MLRKLRRLLKVTKVTPKNFVTFLTFVTCATFIAFAQDNDKVISLSKQIMEASSSAELNTSFEELKGVYFTEHKYTDFVVFLKSLSAQKKELESFANYYIALARYHHLKYLEETQNWDEYFSNGNTYRDELTASAQKVIDATIKKDPLNIRSRLMLWRFHKDQQDVFAEEALTGLMDAVLEYAKDAGQDIALVKEVADQLLSYEQKGKARELYKIYLDRLLSSQIKDEELAKTAADFYQEGNLELAESAYDIYIERMTANLAKEQLVPLLLEIAQKFSYTDQGACDPLYAEKIFEKITAVSNREALNEELIYLRAFNLEKIKEYPKAKENYLDLITRYPATVHADEAEYKIGIINTYILRNITDGRVYFEKLAQKEIISPQVISGIYQLGLLKQWEGDNLKAKEYYDKLIERSGEDFKETVELAKERLKEINEAMPLEHSLKTFLDVSLKEEYAMYDRTKLNLKAAPYRGKKDEPVSIAATAFAGESGCLQIELEYLWSGHLGKVKDSPQGSNFPTQYLHSGTKEINLVVVSPSGIIDRDIDMADVY
ncbi:MAG: hypothetical protein HZC16_02740 [Candidatus Omnitrophica bacterium]|nr:hypothetical protein [Candidatus Omnitrophota bacterium]